MIPPGDWERVCRIADLAGRSMASGLAGGLDVLVCVVAGKYHAVVNRCSHLHKPLDGGRLIAGQIHCPFHSATFDVRSGEALSGPAVSPLRRLAVRIDGEDILVDVSQRVPPED